MNQQDIQAYQLLQRIIQQGYQGQYLPSATLLELGRKSAEFSRVWLAHAIASASSPAELALAVHFSHAHQLPELATLRQFWLQHPQLNRSAEDDTAHYAHYIAPFNLQPLEGAAELWSALVQVENGTKYQATHTAINDNLWQTDLALSADMTQQLIDVTRQHLTEAALYGDQEQHQILNDVRNNKQFISAVPANDVLVASLTRLMAAAQGTPVSHSEPLIFYRYQTGEEFKWHHDYVVSDANSVKEELAVFGQRVRTSVLYLNDQFSGGETRFKHWNKAIKPPRGAMVTFNNLTSDGTPLRESLHAGSPVTEGEKWVATLWSRQKAHWLRQPLMPNNK